MNRSEYFAGHRYEFLGAKYAAQRTLEILREQFEITSALDVGSGPGVWMSTWKTQGVADVLGIDNDEIEPSLWCLSPEQYQTRSVSEPFKLDRTFDVVVSLEVAEHIQSEKTDQFLQNLTQHGEVILFSAAIPLQGGTGHVNEQWPEYWAEKLATLGYRVLDMVRDRLWSDIQCPVWYAQNMLVFVSDKRLAMSEALQTIRVKTQERPLSRVHPRVFEWVKYATQVLPMLPVSLVKLGADVADLRLISAAPAQLLLSERLLLYSLVRALRPRRILEVGTGMGGSAGIMKQALIDSGAYQTQLVTIDPQEAPNVVTPEMHYFLFATGLPIQWDVRCTMILGKTPEALSQIEGKFDLILLDGDHSYAGVSLDLEALQKFLLPTGLLIAHDAHYPEISRAIDEAVEKELYRDTGVATSQIYQYDDGVTAMPWAGFRILKLATSPSDRQSP